MRSSVVDRLTPPSEVDKAKAALKSASEAEPASPPPTALGALSGAVMAGAITYVAYSFTVGVDENFANQAISTNYAVSPRSFCSCCTAGCTSSAQQQCWDSLPSIFSLALHSENFTS